MSFAEVYLLLSVFFGVSGFFIALANKGLRRSLVIGVGIALLWPVLYLDVWLRGN